MTDFQPGDLIDGRYALEERIGLGGMAAVWRARDRSDSDAVVAVKLLREDFLKRNPKEAANNIRRFKRESEILKLMAGSKHVVQARAAGVTEAGDHYLVMELLMGEPLRNQIPRGQRKMGLRTFAWLGRGLVQGLKEIHAQGVIHRDLSPDNIFVVRDAEGLPSPKFLDFGIGKGADGKLDQVTQLVTIMGKPQYFSPEQARGGELGPASDVFSLVVILYEMASGGLPLDLHGLPLVASVKRIVGDPPKDLGATPGGARFPAEIRDILMRGLAKKAEDRPTLDELSAAFVAFSDRLDRGEEFGDGSGAAGSPDRSRTAASEMASGEGVPVTSAEPFLTPSSVMPREFKTGELLGRFEVKERLGRGGMGEVYRAFDTVLHRDVAIKVASKVEGEAAQKALLREARASSRLRSAHIVTVYDAGTQAGLPYIVMEYVEGRTLADIIEEEGPLKTEAFWKYASGIVEGLAVAHENEPKVVHKDLKPANILVAGSVAKIADFGLATFAASGQKGESQLAGAAHGSVHTMSPEQAEGGRPVDERSDIYSLGCVFYMMTTGVPPFDGNEIAVLYQHQTQTPVPPSKKVAGFEPSELERVVMKCLEKDPARRYASARELQRDLEVIFQPLTATQLKPWHRRTPVLVSVVAGLAAVVLLLLFLKSQGEARTFEIRQVAGVTSLGDGGKFVTRGETFPIAYTARSGGELEILITPEGATEPVVLKQAIVRAEGAESFEVVLPKVGIAPDAEIVAYDFVLRRADDGKSAKSFRLFRDLRPPRVRVVAYGIEHDPAAGPIAVLSWRDASIVLHDLGGFKGREDRRIDVRDLWSARSEPAYSTVPGEVLPTSRTVSVTAADAAGFETAATVTLVRAALRLDPAPEDGAVFRTTPLPFSAAFALEPALPGFDPVRELAELTAAAVLPSRAGGEARQGAMTPCKVADGRLSAAVPWPDPSSTSGTFEVGLFLGGEPVLSNLGGARPRPGSPSFHYDAAPPELVIEADGSVIPSVGAKHVVVLRGPGGVRERLVFRVRDAGGRTGDVPRLSVKKDGVAAAISPIADDGAARLGEDVADGATLLIVATDAAGNTAETTVTFERRLQRVGSATLGTAAVADPAKDVVYVNREALDVALKAENLAADERLFVRVDDVPPATSGASSDGPSVPCTAAAGEHRATVDLRTRGAPVCERIVTVLVGRDGGSAREALVRYRVLFDETPPVVTAARAGGRRIASGDAVTGPAFPSLGFELRDDGSGLAATTVKTPVKLEGPAKVELEGVPEPGAALVVVRIAADGGVTDQTRRFRFEVVAKDRAGNVSAPFVVVATTLPRPVSVLSFADDVAYASGVAAPPARKAVRAVPIPVTLRRAPELAGFAIVAASYVEGTDKAKETELSLDDAAAAAGKVFLVAVEAPSSDAPREGRTVFLLRERATGETLGEPLHEVRWLLDRSAPKLTLVRDGAPIDFPAEAGVLRVAKMSGLTIVADDEGGFPAVDVASGAAFDVASPSPARTELRFKDEGGDGRRELRIVVRDAAGNEAQVRFAVEPARNAPQVAEAKTAGGAKSDAGVLTNAPSVDYAIANDTVDADAVQATVTDSGGGVVFTSPIQPLVNGRNALKVVWPTAVDGAYTVSLTHFRGAAGRAAEPFDVRKFVVDTTPPALVVLVSGAPFTGEDLGSLGTTDDFVIVASDTGSGVNAESYSAVLLAPTGTGAVPLPALASGGAEPRFKVGVSGASGKIELEFVVFDLAGNAAKRRLRFELPEVGGAGSSVAPRTTRRLSDYSAAEIATALQTIRAQSGVELVPIQDGGATAFYLSRTEVTESQFRKFVEAYRSDPDKTAETIRAATKRAAPKLEDIERIVQRGGGDDLPVVGVPENVAAAFSAWVGGTLPTYDEWRGAAGRYRQSGALFPLRADGSAGLSTDKNFANYDTNRPRAVAELGEGLFGLKGMAGNASEWVVFERTRGVAGGSYRAESALFFDCLKRDRPNSENDASVRNTIGIRVRWPAER